MSPDQLKPDEVLETPAQLAKRIGVPVSNIRHLIRSGQLAHVYLSEGRRNPKIPLAAWPRYLAQQMGTK